MGKKCSVIGCYSGYDDTKNRKKAASAELADTDVEPPTKVRLYSFPKDAALRAEWIRMIPNYVDDNQAAKGNMAVCSDHFPQDCRYNDKEGIHRRPIDPPSIFHIKQTSCVGTPGPKPRTTTRATASVRRDDANFDPDMQLKELIEREKIKTSQLKERMEALLNLYSCFFVWNNATSLSVFSNAREGAVFDFCLHFSVIDMNGYANIKYEAFNKLQQYFLQFPMDRTFVSQWQQIEILLQRVCAPTNELTEKQLKSKVRFDFLYRQLLLLNTPKNKIVYSNDDLLLSFSWYTQSR